jgi:hypothetical protein
MFKKLGKIGGLTAAALAGAIGGACLTAAAADMIDKMATTKSNNDLKGIYSSSGESPEALAKAKTLGVTNYEEDAKAGGGGAQQKVLVDNDTVRVNLVSFKKGFIRPGGLMRKNDQLLVYLDEGQFTLIKTGNNTPVAKPNSQRLLPGSSVFHSRGSIVSESLIDQDYRVLFIEMKK